MTPGLPFGPHQKVEKRLPQGNYSTGKECFFYKPEENPTSRSVLPPQPPAPSSACEFGTQVQARATQSNPTSHSPFRRPAARRKRTSSSAPLYCKFYRGRAQRWSGVTCDHRSTSEVQCEDSGSARPLSFTLCPRASQTLQTWMPKNTFQALKVAWHVCIHNLQVQGSQHSLTNKGRGFGGETLPSRWRTVLRAALYVDLHKFSIRSRLICSQSCTSPECTVVLTFLLLWPQSPHFTAIPWNHLLGINFLPADPQARLFCWGES